MITEAQASMVIAWACGWMMAGTVLGYLDWMAARGHIGRDWTWKWRAR